MKTALKYTTVEISSATNLHAYRSRHDCTRSPNTTAIMSSLNPTGPSQPPLDDVYKTSGNPASKEPAEAASADRTNASDAPIA